VAQGLEAVIFDWGGTLTPWHSIDPDAEARALARAVRSAGGAPDDGDDADEAATAALLGRAVQAVWTRSVREHTSATVADIFTEAGLAHDESLLVDYRAFWEPHSLTDPDVRPLLEGLRADGLRVGILSNTVWPRSWHEEIFARDGVLDLIDGAVYSSEVPWTKPAPEAFRAAAAAAGASDPARCVFVGDRLFDDVWGAAQVGMRTVHVPHSAIPAVQLGHSEGSPDAVVERLADVHAVVRGWMSADSSADRVTAP
jgi:putative hydrolase of the HAD superfamily